MKVLSLFDGMSCGRVALERAGIKPTIYFASEIDKYAIKIAQKNFPDTIQLGDVVEVRKLAEQGLFGKMDLLIGGSPCQGFSFSGKQLAFDDPRSALFFEYVKTLKALQRDNPDIKFLLENVRMKKEHLQVITEQLGVEPVCINSALVSAQNRVRYYWANWKIEQPEDRGILLKDILEDGVLEKLYKPNNRTLKQVRDKKPIKVCNVNPSGRGMNGCVYHADGKSPTLTTNKGEGVKITGGALRGRYIVDGKRQDHKMKTAGLTTQRLELREDGKCNTVTTVAKDSLVCVQPRLDEIYYSKLTPIECERLMSLEDNHTEGVSNSQRYKMIGNGWETATITHIFIEMIKSLCK